MDQQAPDDLTLLRRYANENSAGAFATLVARHADFVFATALRHTRRRDLAEDVTQASFIVLARRAGCLREGTSIRAFLHQTAIYGSKNVLRAQSRRRWHEQRAAEAVRLEQAESTVDPDPAAVAIDGALLRLRHRDRQLLMLHYFDGFTLAEAAAKLAISHEAARKRLHRALSRLRSLLRREGVSLTEAAVPSALAAITSSAGAVKASSLASAAVAGGADGASFQLAHTMVQMMKITTFAKTTAAIAAVVLIAGGVTTVAVRQMNRSQPAPPTAPTRAQAAPSTTTTTTVLIRRGGTFITAPSPDPSNRPSVTPYIIDYAWVFSNAPRTMAMRAELEKQRVALQQESQQRQARIQELQKQRDAATPGSPTVVELSTLMRAAVAERDEWAKTQQAASQRAQAKAMLELYMDVEQAMTKVAREQGVALPDLGTLPALPKDAERTSIDQLRRAINARQIRRPAGVRDLSEDVLSQLKQP
jgi:RNA polymerase sigma factor (sigma-70 family)